MIKDLVKNNRSYRGYDENVAVSEDKLMEIIDVVRLVGSAGNLQPLKYRLVTDVSEVKKVNGITKWGKMLKDINLPYPGKYPTSYIVICVDTEIVKTVEAAGIDIGIAAQTILLFAVEQKLGGCMIGNFEKSSLSKALFIPDRYIPGLVVAIGSPDENIVITDVKDGNTKYYRDENDVHFVPKRQLEDVIISADISD